MQRLSCPLGHVSTDTSKTVQAPPTHSEKNLSTEGHTQEGGSPWVPSSQLRITWERIPMESPFPTTRRPSGPPVTYVLRNLMVECLKDHLTWREVSIWGGPPHCAGFCQRNLLVRTFLILKFYSFICFNCNFNFFLRSMFFSSLFLSLSVHWLLSSLPWQNTWRKAPSGNGLGAQGLRALLIREGKAWWPMSGGWPHCKHKQQGDRNKSCSACFLLWILPPSQSRR